MKTKLEMGVGAGGAKDPKKVPAPKRAVPPRPVKRGR